jgi:hypothetical protein
MNRPRLRSATIMPSCSDSFRASRTVDQPAPHSSAFSAASATGRRDASRRDRNSRRTPGGRQAGRRTSGQAPFNRRPVRSSTARRPRERRSRRRCASPPGSPDRRRHRPPVPRETLQCSRFRHLRCPRCRSARDVSSPAGQSATPSGPYPSVTAPSWLSSTPCRRGGTADRCGGAERQPAGCDVVQRPLATRRLVRTPVTARSAPRHICGYSTEAGSPRTAVERLPAPATGIRSGRLLASRPSVPRCTASHRQSCCQPVLGAGSQVLVLEGPVADGIHPEAGDRGAAGTHHEPARCQPWAVRAARIQGLAGQHARPVVSAVHGSELMAPCPGCSRGHGIRRGEPLSVRDDHLSVPTVVLGIPWVLLPTTSAAVLTPGPASE